MPDNTLHYDGEQYDDGRVRGIYRNDQSFIGFDYTDQAWIDTSPSCSRDPTAPLGSARNPRRTLEGPA